MHVRLKLPDSNLVARGKQDFFRVIVCAPKEIQRILEHRFVDQNSSLLKNLMSHLMFRMCLCRFLVSIRFPFLCLNSVGMM